jgi:anti-anti-sigma factor
VNIVRVFGAVDSLTSEVMLEEFLSQIKEGAVRLVADLTGVDYTSSAGLRSLLVILKEIRQKGGDLRLAGVQSNVMKVLTLSGFTSIIKVYDDVDTAVASYGGA